MINLVDLVGYTAPRFSQKGGLVCALLRRGPVSPNTVPGKKTEGVRARHGLRASWQRVRIEF